MVGRGAGDNLNDGKVERREMNVHPMLGSMSFTADPRAVAMNPDKASILVERDPTNEEEWSQLWRWYPASGEKRESPCYFKN